MLLQLPDGIVERHVCAHLDWNDALRLTMTCTDIRDRILPIFKQQFAEQMDTRFSTLKDGVWDAIYASPTRYKEGAIMYMQFLELAHARFLPALTSCKNRIQNALYHASHFYHTLVVEEHMSAEEYELVESIRIRLRPIFEPHLVAMATLYPDFVVSRIVRYVR